MKFRRTWKLGSLVGAMVAVLAAEVSFAQPNSCPTPANRFEKIATLIVTVPEERQTQYADELTALLREFSPALKVMTGSSFIYPPRKSGPVFRHYNINACNKELYFWSSNAVRPTEHVVTLHEAPNGLSAAGLEKRVLEFLSLKQLSFRSSP